MRIYIKRRTEEKYNKYIYLIFELMCLSKNWFNKITINDLDFTKFKKKLIKNSDFYFNKLQKNLIYINISEMNILITDELIWKIKIKEIY